MALLTKMHRSRLKFQQVLKPLEPTHMVGNGFRSAVRNDNQLSGMKLNWRKISVLPFGQASLKSSSEAVG